MKEIKWSAPEFHYYEKDVSWYWLLIIGTIILTSIALWQKNFLFAIFIVIAALLSINWGKREPEMVDFTLSEKGLDINGKKLHPFENLLGFAIINNPQNQEISELILKTKNYLNSWIKIIIASEQIDEIKSLLSQFLEEIEYTESLSDQIGKILKF